MKFSLTNRVFSATQGESRRGFIVISATYSPAHSGDGAAFSLGRTVQHRQTAAHSVRQYESGEQEGEYIQHFEVDDCQEY